MSDEKKITLYSYSKVWKVEKKIYSIYNLKLPVPINLDQGLYMLGAFGFMLIPIFSFLPAVIRFFGIPAILSRFLLKKKLDGKNPIRYFFSYLRYLIIETGSCLERFEVKRIMKEDKENIQWECSQGYYPKYEVAEGKISTEEKKIKARKDKPEKVKAEKSIEINKKPKKKVEKKQSKKKVEKIEKAKKSKAKKDSGNKLKGEDIQIQKAAKLYKPQKRQRNVDIAADENQISAADIIETQISCSIFWLKCINQELKERSISVIKSNYIMVNFEQYELNDLNSNVEGIKVILCTLENTYLRALAEYIRGHKKAKKECRFVFLDVSTEERKKLDDLMEGYHYYCFSSIDETKNPKLKDFLG